MDLNDRERELATLSALAKDAMCEEADDAAAQARERLLQMYRARWNEAHRLNLEKLGEAGRWDVIPMRSAKPGAGRAYLVMQKQLKQHETVWEETDNHGLGWLCTLADAGHAGAARLADRVLRALRLFRTLYVEDSDGSWSYKAFRVEDSEGFQALGKKFPRVARHYVWAIADADKQNVHALVEWLERAGRTHALIASALREMNDWQAIASRAIATLEPTRPESAQTPDNPNADIAQQLIKEIARTRGQ
jgi:hypothetical protein